MEITFIFTAVVFAGTLMKTDCTYALILLWFFIYCRLLIVLMTYHAGDEVGY